MRKPLSECKKIGFMGGTFNPIHTGHLMLAEWTMEQEGLDAVMFIPTGVSYLKDARIILPGETRLEMVDLAIGDREKFCSCDIEIKKQGNTYTSETLQCLKEIYPDSEFYFICGADCLFYIDSWKDPQILFDNCVLCAASRNGASVEELEAKKKILEEKFQARISLLTFPNMEISSTDIRSRVSEGKSIHYMVPDAVENYILEHGYYR